jgi:myosin heavy subunit
MKASLPEHDNPPDDLIKLQNVNRPGILHALHSRFVKDRIYTSIGPILVALNPFKWIPGIYEEEVKEKYKFNQYNLSENPHVFAVAHGAYSDLTFGKDQSLIIRLATPHFLCMPLHCLQVSSFELVEKVVRVKLKLQSKH